MNLKSIYMENFLSHKKSYIELKEENIYLIVGKREGTSKKSNGTGKSCFQEALTWCSFGESRFGGKNYDDLIKYGEDEALVRISFELNDEDIVIERSKKRGGTTKLYCSKFTGATLKETQDYIISLLRMDYEVFRNSCCFRQGESDSFSKLTPKESKDVIINILQLDIYDKCHKHCSNVSRDLRLKENSLSSSLEKSRKDCVNNLSAEDLMLQKSNLETAIKTLREDVLRLGKLIESKNENLKDVTDKKEKLEQPLFDLSAELGGLSNEQLFIKKNIFDIENIGAKCEACGQDISNDYKDKILSNYNKQLKSLEGQIKKVEERIKDQEKEVKLVKEDQLKIQVDITKLNHSLRNVELDTVKNEEGLIRWNELLERVKNQEVEIRNLEDELLQVKRQISIYEVLEKAFGKNGIPSYIIDNVIPELQEIANSILGEVTENSFRVELSTQRELKNKMVGDSLDIFIYSNNSKKPYLSYSGGEKFLIDFSLRIALSVLLSRRNECKIQTLFIDEGLGNLDESNRDNFVSILDVVFKKFDFKKIFLITHSTDVQDYFNNRIEVIKKGDTSCIEGQEITELENVIKAKKSKNKKVEKALNNQLNKDVRNTSNSLQSSYAELW